MSGFIGGISTSFTIQDYATPALDKIADGLKVAGDLLDNTTKAAEAFAKVRFGGVTRSLGALSDQFDAAATAAERLEKVRFGNLSRSLAGMSSQVDNLAMSSDAMAFSFESAMNRMAAESVRGEAAINALEAAMMRAMATARGLGAVSLGNFGGGLGGGGGGGRGGGGHGSGRGHVYLGSGGLHAAARLGTSLPALGAGFLAYESFKMGGEVDLALRNAVMNLGEPDPMSEQGQRMMSILAQSLRGGTGGTRFSEEEAAKVLPDFLAMVSPGVTGTPEERARKLQGLTGSALRFSETEQQMGHGNLESNMRTSAEFAHLLRAYSPEEIGPRMDKLLAISRLTGLDPQEIERVMKYSVTTGGLGGVDPDNLLSQTGFLIQSGITGTTAGTGLAQVINSIMKGEKLPAAAHDQVERLHRELSVRQEFERAMRGEVGVEKHIERQRKSGPGKESEVTKDLIALGVLDPSSHKLMPGLQGPGGGINEAAVIQQMVSRAATMPGHEGGRLIEGAMGTRGARALEPFMGEGGQIFKQYMEMEKKYTEEIGVAITQLHQSQAPLQEMQQAWARAKDVMVEFVNAGGPADSALAELGKAAKAAADALGGLVGWISSHQDQAKEGVQTAGGFVAGAAAGAVAGAGIGAFGGPIGAGGGALIGGALGAGSVLLNRSTGGHVNLGNPIDLTPRQPQAPVPFDKAPGGPIFGPQMLHKESFNSGGGVNVHIQNVSFAPGTPREHADQFAQELAGALSRAQLHDLGTGYGHQQSSFTTGRTLSA